MAENRELASVLKLVADNFQSELKKSGGLLGEFSSIVKDWKTQLATAGTVLFAIAKSTANYGDELVKSGQRMGTSIQDTARLQHAANLAGTDLQGLTTTVGFLSKEMYAAATGNAEAQKTFDRLGLSVTNSNGQLKGTTEMLVEISDKFRVMPEGPQKTALAMMALGKSGKDVLPLLNSDLRESALEADRLGLTMSDKAAKAAEHFNDELTKLQAAIRGVTNDVGTMLIPKFDAMAHALTTIITDARSAAISLGDLLKLNQLDQAAVGIVQPKDGGRRLRILPDPPGIDKAVVTPVLQTEAGAKAEDDAKKQHDLGLKIMREATERYKLELAKREEELGKHKVCMFVTEQNSIAIIERMRRESDEAEDERVALSNELDEEVDQEKLARQMELGRVIVQRTGVEVAIREKAHKGEMDALIANESAWASSYQQIGGDAETLYGYKMDLLRAQLAKELDLTKRQAAELLLVWRNNDRVRADEILANSPKSDLQKETARLNAIGQATKNLQETGGDFFSSWAKGCMTMLHRQAMGSIW